MPSRNHGLKSYFHLNQFHNLLNGCLASENVLLQYIVSQSGVCIWYINDILLSFSLFPFFPIDETSLRFVSAASLYSEVPSLRTGIE